MDRSGLAVVAGRELALVGYLPSRSSSASNEPKAPSVNTKPKGAEMPESFPNAYVVWCGDDGPSLHGPFADSDEALKWAWDDETSFNPETAEEYDTAEAWYNETPNVWIRPLLAP